MSWFDSALLKPIHDYTMNTFSPLIGEMATKAMLWGANAGIVIAVIMVNVLVVVWLERKILGRMMNRRGPVYAGPPVIWGFFQAIADFLKLLTKEVFRPAKADPLTYMIGPAIMVFSALGIGLMVPFGHNLIGLENEASLLYIIALASIEPLGVMLMGLSANNKFSLIGGMRSAAQMISYELPAILVLVTAALLAGSVDILQIANAQNIWYAILIPLGFVIFLITMLAELERTPFDIPEAESELVAGFMTEHGGMYYGMVMATEYISIFVTAALAAAVFLGGYGFWGMEMVQASVGAALFDLITLVVFLIKVYVIVFFIIWVRAVYFRLRIDQLLDLGWKRLFPLAIVNFFWAIAIFLALG
ncbi:MAG: NADH-quinone oxidoreductase subunit NuoH [Archaeoglobaceae archaeon]